MLLKSGQQEKDSRGSRPAVTSTVGASPEMIMTASPPTENTLDDTAIYALSVMQPRNANNVYKWDFEANGMVRKVRKPRGLAVAVEAYGIRWIVEIHRRTLLTGEKIAEHFPWLTRTARAPRGTPTVRIGTVTIAPGWVQDEDYVLVAQPCRVNRPVLRELPRKTQDD
jgi:hypothetical protein